MEVILTHEHADFDALASLLAASKLWPGAVAVLPRELNRNLRDFLVLYRGTMPFRRVEDLPLKEKVAQAIFVDTQTAQAIRGMTHNTPVRIIDHHECAPDLPAHYHCWSEPVGATTTLLVEQIISRGIVIAPVEATLLLLGIYEDTGSLSYVGTTARDVRCAAYLLERGANLEVANDFLHHPLTPDQQLLLKQLGDAAQTYTISGHTVVIAAARAEGYVDEISTLAHKMRDLFDPDALLLVVDLVDRIQIVARSTTPRINVGAVAAELGGGGHARAAAALVRGQTLEETVAQLLALLHRHVRPPTTVRDIMSWRLNALAPETSVAEAARRAHRLGHEGFPVVENGRLVGLATRREIDRAMQHGLQNAPVRRIMREGQTTVQVDDAIPTLQKVMTETGWGQMPVVENGTLVGIVTRTDLLKLWASADDDLSSPSMALMMQGALPEGLLALLHKVGQAASELNYCLYAVGGFVRDLLLGFPNLDVDLVVEGDAAALARKLAHEHGGRVRAHRQFGTAKWIRSDEAMAAGANLPDETPASLDFATARVEFYEQATALPVVESSNIKLDLHRRDFTINTLTIRLDGPHWGELLDFYGGQRDLHAGVIRVLHSLSFVEDPTRILRAVRFEQRFGFSIEPRTAELIADAIELLPRLSGARIRHELELVYLEREPERSMQRLAELGVLAAIHPLLTWNAGLTQKYQTLRSLLDPLPALPLSLDRLYFSLWLYHADAETQQAVISYLRVSSTTVGLLREGRALLALRPALLAPHLPNSELDRLLAPFSDAALLVACADSEDWVLSKRLNHYRTYLRPQEIALTGKDLQAMGLRPGPIYRRVLTALRAARLDGQVQTAQEEAALARQLIAQDERVAAR